MRTYEHKLWSIVALVERFERGAALTTRDIAAGYEVDLRTAERWVKDIAEHYDLERFRDPLGGPAVWRKATDE